MNEEEVDGFDNLIVLCANHHRIVDQQPSKYTVEVLNKFREQHVARLTAALVTAEGPRGAGLLAEALDVWGRESANANEEFWQQFFESRPALLITVAQRDLVWLESKCYVGGKRLDNTGSNLLDFLAQGSGNATLIEIKTPASRLLGSHYRENVWLPSRELVGATIQVLEYRSSLLSNIHALSAITAGLEAPDPSCVVLIGNLAAEDLTRPQRRSFELYRQALRSVLVVTYDELFERLRATSALLAPGD